MKERPSVGDSVYLQVPENHHLHGKRAKVVSLTEWGAHVETAAAATGTFRAFFSEMIPAQSAKSINRLDYKEVGYTGDICDKCGSSQMKRSGNCLVCENCGDGSNCG